MRTFMLLLSFVLCNSAPAFESAQALQDAFVAALVANDVEGLAACYTADATNFPVDSLSGMGPDAVRASWGAYFELYRVTGIEISNDHMEVSGDLAVAWGLFTMTAEPLAGGEVMVMQGRFMDVAKNIDGQWLYIADHASLPLPPSE